MQPSSPWYLDWQFWAFAMAALAIILSQLPPLRLWFRSGKLEVMVQNRIHITHKVGNPVVGLFVSLSSAGKSLRVMAGVLTLERDGHEVGKYPLQGFFENQTSPVQSIFMPFHLRPEEAWTHAINFYPEPNRADEKAYRQHEAALRADVQEKLSVRQGQGLVYGDAALAQPLVDMLQRNFMWTEGEYTVVLELQTNTPKPYRERFQFTLFEADSTVLQAFERRYATGDGLWFWDHNIGVNVPLHVV